MTKHRQHRHRQLKTRTDLGITVDASDYTQEQRTKLVALLYANRDLFTSDICQLPGTDLVTHSIDTGDATPIRQRACRHSPEARKELDRQIDRLLEADIIEESDSPWGSPVVFVKKRNNTHRLRRHEKSQLSHETYILSTTLAR